MVLEQPRGTDWSLTEESTNRKLYSKQSRALNIRASYPRNKIIFQANQIFLSQEDARTTLDIATTTNSSGNQVVQYFTAQTNIFPETCGSYYRLSDNNSKLANQWARWGLQSSKYFVGKWQHDGRVIANRLVGHAAFVAFESHWLVESNGRWECDNYKDTKALDYEVSSGDFWKIFVR